MELLCSFNKAAGIVVPIRKKYCEVFVRFQALLQELYKITYIIYG